MEDNLTDFQRKLQGMLNPFNLFLVVLEIGFLVFAGVTFANVLAEPEVVPEVGADEFVGQIEGLSRELSGDVGAAVYNVVSLNTGGNVVIDEAGVVVRDGSLIRKTFDNAGVSYTSFIVDLPELEQSYRVYYDEYDWSDEDEVSGGAPEVIVTCLLGGDEVIYEGFDCKDGSNGLTGYYIARGHEDFMGGYKVYLSGDRRVDGTTQEEPYVEILSYCGDGMEEDAVKAVGDYFGELGLRLADFNYGMMSECEYYNEDEG